VPVDGLGVSLPQAASRAATSAVSAGRANLMGGVSSCR
jgi:hypothetical protein